MKSLSILLSMLFALPLAGINEPVPPAVPSVTGSSNDSSHTAPATPPVGSKKRGLLVQITREDGKSVRGTALFPSKPIVINHVVGGIQYTRRIIFSELSSLRVLRWGAIAGGGTASKRLYYFMPVAWAFRTRDGQRFRYTKRLRFLERLVIVNRYGRAAFYGYFADYWIATGAQAGYWQNGGGAKFSLVREKPEPACYVRIAFQKGKQQR